MSQANAIQHGGTHYKDQTIQPWDFIAQNNLGFLEGNVVKYVSRWKKKNGLEDLKKAQHYLEKLIELEQDRKQAQDESRIVHRIGFPGVTADDVKAATITAYPFLTGVVPRTKVV